MNATQHPLEPLLRALQLRSSLDHDDQRALRGLPFKVRHLEASTHIVREGDLPETCAILLSGYAYRHKLTGDGARQIIALHLAGEALDFQHLFLEVADHSIQMMTGGEVALIPRTAIQELVLTRPAVANAIVCSILVDSSISREWVLNVGRRDARARLAHLLCEFAIRMDAYGLAGPDGYNLPITQEQLADATGLTTVHVNRTLKGLEASGLIARSKRTISFPIGSGSRTPATSVLVTCTWAPRSCSRRSTGGVGRVAGTLGRQCSGGLMQVKARAPTARFSLQGGERHERLPTVLPGQRRPHRGGGGGRIAERCRSSRLGDPTD